MAKNICPICGRHCDDVEMDFAKAQSVVIDREKVEAFADGCHKIVVELA